MKTIMLRQALAIAALVAGTPMLAAAATVTVEVEGTLGPVVLPAVHGDFGGAPISGSFQFDSDDRQIQSGNSNPFYELTSWSIDVQGTNGSSLLLESSGETYDAGTLTLSTSFDRLVLLIDEDIDNPGTGAIEDTTFRLYFDTLIDITVNTTFDDLGELAFDSSGSLLQFSTSQAPMTVASASLSIVPLPAAAWLFGSALIGLGWLRRKT